jgi:integrase
MDYVILREYILFGTFIWVQAYESAMKNEGGIIEDFIYGLGDRTKGQYLSRLVLFFDFLEIKPGRGTAAVDRLEIQAAQFLKEFKSKGKEGGKEWAQKCLMRFVKHLNEKVKEGKFGRGTIRNYYKTVKRFCDTQNIELSWKRITSGLGKVKRVANDRAPTLEEIQRLIQYPDRRIKPIVLIMISSGIRIGAWEYLKWKHIRPLDIDGQPVDKDLPAREDDQIAAAKISVYGGEEDEYFSFITPEAYQSLKEWMDFRAANGEGINEESPVMRDIFAFKYGRSTAQNPRMLLAESVWKIIERGLKVQGIRQPLVNGAKRYEFQGAHGFRKYFKIRAEQAGMRPFNVETLMDHSLGINDHYGRPMEQDLISAYLKVVEALTINKQIEFKEVAENQQVLLLQMQTKDREITMLKKQMTELKSREQEIAMLKQRLSEMNTLTKEVDSMREQIAALKRSSDEFKKLSDMTNLLQEAVEIAKIVDPSLAIPKSQSKIS